ncbi:MAG TPA: sigma-70 family RNA polymerase sigma factor [Actinokineospora sp.]|jgi:RNA polymerase sigma-70 factor (ECF subfamily)|nr:sigma-70 family RNA polymerase sigma factor [Actinokineospora sp.]
MGADEEARLLELIERVQRGEPGTMGELIAIVRPRVIECCRTRMARWESRMGSVDDVAQEACIAVMSMVLRHQWVRGAFWPMVSGVVNHKFLDARRIACRDHSEPVWVVPDIVDEALPGPEDGALRMEDTRMLRRLLAPLPESCRRLLWMRLGLGCSSEEVATELGCTVDAVRLCQHRTVTRLRRHLTRLGPSAPDIVQFAGFP